MPKRPEGSSEDRQAALGRDLEDYQALLRRYMQIRARGLLRHESLDDLVQGAWLRAIERADHFDDRGDTSFLAWIRVIARRHIADRHDYWKAARRHATQILRVSTDGQPGDHGGREVNPVGPHTGPVSLAIRRERLQRMTQVIGQMEERDREILESGLRGDSNADLAGVLGVSAGAAEIARRRSLDRLRRAFGRDPHS